MRSTRGSYGGSRDPCSYGEAASRSEANSSRGSYGGSRDPSSYGEASSRSEANSSRGVASSGVFVQGKGISVPIAEGLGIDEHVRVRALHCEGRSHLLLVMCSLVFEGSRQSAALCLCTSA